MVGVCFPDGADEPRADEAGRLTVIALPSAYDGHLDKGASWISEHQCRLGGLGRTR